MLFRRISKPAVTAPVALAVAAVTAPLLAGCGALEGGAPSPADSSPPASASGSDSSSGSGSGSGAGDGRAVSPLGNPDGTRPGLAPLTSERDRATARHLIEKLHTKGRGPKTGYDRDEFGYAWMDTADGVPLARNGCDTRNDLLQRDGQSLRFRSGSDCVVVSMTLADPYTGKDIGFEKQHAMDVQIDHVVPLSYAWQLGAAQWNESRREQLANDPLNLLPVDGPANSAKGDSGPASWLPPRKEIRCAYAVRFAQVATAYELPVTTADKQTMLSRCGG